MINIKSPKLFFSVTKEQNIIFMFYPNINKKESPTSNTLKQTYYKT